LLLDGRGNLYGITKYGGTSGEGTVFQLTPSAQGWKESILKNFILRDAGGLDPSGNLIFDKAGNLYGTTLFGGNLSGCPGAGCGTVYELTPGQEGKWTETVLYAPPDAYHGSYPTGGLVFDASGNLYGADLQEIFELRPSGGARTKNAIHTFTGTPDGYQPNGNLIFDKAGNLYGTTYIGGTGTGATCDSEGCGTVFELSPRGDGTWNESILHSFSENGTDGYLTYASVILGPGGVLYGTAPLGGNQTNCYGGACGIAFALVPKSGGGWTKRFFTTLVAIAAVVPNQTWL